MRLTSLLLATALLSAPMQAALVLSGPAPDNSNAVQAQSSMLNLNRGQGNATAESACVLIDSVLLGSNYVYTPCPAGFSGGDQTPSSSRTFSAGQQNILNAADLRLTFDAVESGGDDITIDRLVLYFWNPVTGAALIAGGIELSPAPYVLNTTLSGNGKAELVFKLDPQSIADLTNAGFNATTIIGIAVNISNVSSGAEAFYLSNQVTAEGVPEPATWWLGLSAAAWVLGRKRVKRTILG